MACHRTVNKRTNDGPILWCASITSYKAAVSPVPMQCRGLFVYAPSQWETTLHCNVVSHWQGSFTKWSLQWSYHSIVLSHRNMGHLNVLNCANISAETSLSWYRDWLSAGALHHDNVYYRNNNQNSCSPTDVSVRNDCARFTTIFIGK